MDCGDTLSNGHERAHGGDTNELDHAISGRVRLRPLWAGPACFVLLLFAAASARAQPASFTDSINFPTGQGPDPVAVGFFNGDSDPDLAVGTADGVSILLGTPGESFTGPTNFRAGFRSPRSLAVGDFNGDSHPDLAATSETGRFPAPGTVSILLGDGTGGFTSPTDFVTGGGSVSVATADFNGDSDTDLAVGNFFSDNVSILLGAAGGSFTGPTNFTAGDGPGSVAVGNFNGDSDPDLAVANYSSGNISILLGAAGGSFTGPTNVAAGDFPESVAVGDFNGDSDPDLAIVNSQYPEVAGVSILLGGAGASFSGPASFTVPRPPRSIAVGDFNGDSDPDLATAIVSSGIVSVLLGAPGGSFTGPTNYAVGSSSSYSVAAGDLNGDLRPDLVVANLNTHDVSILVNAAGAPQLTDSDPDSPANANSPRVKGTADAGTTVRLYKAPTSADCTPANLAALPGTAAEFASPGLRVLVPLADNSSTLFRATATDAAGHTSACSPSSVDYVEDSAAPAPPSVTATDPASPANANSPRVIGAAETDSTVSLYRAPARADCIPANLVATGTAAGFASPGVQLSVPIADNSSNTFRARATDRAGNTSGCSTIFVDYVEDSAAPAPPSFIDTDPESPANDRSPLVKGAAEAGSTVRLYKAPTAADCTAPNLAATGTAAEFASPGLPASVPDNSTTTFRATATDAAGNASACSSSSIVYVEDSRGALTVVSAPSPVAADKPPRLTLAGRSSQRIGRRGKVYVLVECDEACTASASATASVKHASKVFRTGKVTRSLAAGRRARLGLRFSKQGTHAIRRALGRHKRVTARVAVTTKNSAGNASSAKRKIRLRR